MDREGVALRILTHGEPCHTGYGAMSSDQTCTEIAGEPISRKCQREFAAFSQRTPSILSRGDHRIDGRGGAPGRQHNRRRQTLRTTRSVRQPLCVCFESPGGEGLSHNGRWTADKHTGSEALQEFHKAFILPPVLRCVRALHLAMGQRLGLHLQICFSVNACCVD